MQCLVAKDSTTGYTLLIDLLNTHCQQLFTETVEENFWAPADVPSQELHMLGVPIQTKHRRCIQESLLNLDTMKQLSLAPHQPAVHPPLPDYRIMPYVPTPSPAGTKMFKERNDKTMPPSCSKPPSLQLPLVRKSTSTSLLFLYSHPWDFCPLHTSDNAYQSGNFSRCSSSHITFFSGAHFACQSDHLHVTQYWHISKLGQSYAIWNWELN
ncbi:hypothetical protein QTP70_021895, partial [Hemibagrus guttatus]